MVVVAVASIDIVVVGGVVDVVDGGRSDGLRMGSSNRRKFIVTIVDWLIP